MGHPVILVVGDWLVDEHWVVGKHRAVSSSRTGREHARALHRDTCSVPSLCGAGQVATILHECIEHGKRPFRVNGIGLWHPDDTERLAAMLVPSSNIGNTPQNLTFRMETPPTTKTVHLYDLAVPPTIVGTTRVIRIYRQIGDRPDLKERIDWELPLSVADLDHIQHRTDMAIRPLREARLSVEHIVVKDLLKGAMSPALIQWLKNEYPRASWYISSKAWHPVWLGDLPAQNVKLFMIPQLASQKALDRGAISSAWMTSGGEPSEDAIKVLDGLAAMLPHARVVVLPEGIRVLARDLPSHSRRGRALVMPLGGNAETFPFTPMASVFFPAIIAHLVQKRESDFLDILRRAMAFTSAWERAEARRITDINWIPAPEQILSLDSDAMYPVHNWKTFDWQEVIDRWRKAFEYLGIIKAHEPLTKTVREEFHLWRGMTDLRNYVVCSPAKRTVVLDLLVHGRSLVNALKEDRRSKSFMIVDSPGGGKSYMVKCLAETLRMPHLKFNITQLLNRTSLIECFNAIRAEQDEHPDRPLLVFIDEVNAKIDGQHVYDTFLEPLEDGSYTQGGNTFQIAPCMWIFAGTERPASEGTATPENQADKGADFESRLTTPVLYLNRNTTVRDVDADLTQEELSDIRISDASMFSKDKIEDLAMVEQVYVGVAAICQTYPDVSKVSKKVLWAFRLIPQQGPRSIRRFVRSFQYVQYGRVMDHNLPKGWHKAFAIGHDLIREWMKAKDDEQSLVEIRTHAEVIR